MNTGGGVLYNEHRGRVCFTVNIGGWGGVLYNEHKGVGRGALQ